MILVKLGLTAVVAALPVDGHKRRASIVVKFRSIAFAGIAALALAFHPGVASAQTQVAAVGTDGYTRAMWRGTDGSISLWKLDTVPEFCRVSRLRALCRMVPRCADYSRQQYLSVVALHRRQCTSLGARCQSKLYYLP